MRVLDPRRDLLFAFLASGVDRRLAVDLRLFSTLPLDERGRGRHGSTALFRHPTQYRRMLLQRDLGRKNYILARLLYTIELEEIPQGVYIELHHNLMLLSPSLDS